MEYFNKNNYIIKYHKIPYYNLSKVIREFKINNDDYQKFAAKKSEDSVIMKIFTKSLKIDKLEQEYGYYIYIANLAGFNDLLKWIIKKTDIVKIIGYRTTITIMHIKILIDALMDKDYARIKKYIREFGKCAKITYGPSIVGKHVKVVNKLAFYIEHLYHYEFDIELIDPNDIFLYIKNYVISRPDNSTGEGSKDGFEICAEWEKSGVFTFEDWENPKVF